MKQKMSLELLEEGSSGSCFYEKKNTHHMYIYVCILTSLIIISLSILLPNMHAGSGVLAVSQKITMREGPGI